MTFKEWVRSNVPTDQDDDLGEVAVYDHPVGEECPVCGETHSVPVTEQVSLDELENFGNYVSAYKNNSPEKDALVAEAKSNGSGHDRFFNQA